MSTPLPPDYESLAAIYGESCAYMAVYYQCKIIQKEEIILESVKYIDGEEICGVSIQPLPKAIGFIQYSTGRFEDFYVPDIFPPEGSTELRNMCEMFKKVRCLLQNRIKYDRESNVWTLDGGISEAEKYRRLEREYLAPTRPASPQKEVVLKETVEPQSTLQRRKGYFW